VQNNGDRLSATLDLSAKNKRLASSATQRTTIQIEGSLHATTRIYNKNLTWLKDKEDYELEFGACLHEDRQQYHLTKSFDLSNFHLYPVNNHR
jgi:hypothetical protein